MVVLKRKRSDGSMHSFGVWFPVSLKLDFQIGGGLSVDTHVFGLPPQNSPVAQNTKQTKRKEI